MWIQLVVAVVVFFLSRFLWFRWKYDLHRVPSPPGHPIVGHVKEMFHKKHKLQNLYLRKQFKNLGYPKMIRVNYITTPLLFVRDVDFVRNVVMSKTDPFPRLVNNSLSVLPLLGNDEHAKFMFKVKALSPYQKAVRKIYATAMQAQHLKNATPSILNYLDKVISAVDQQRRNGQVDLKELFTKLTLDVIGKFALDTNLGALDGSRNTHQLFKDAKLVVMERFRNPLMKRYHLMFPWLKEARRRELKIEQLIEAYRNLVHSFIDREDPPEGVEPIWYALKTMQDPETGEALKFTTLVAEVANVIFAGMDTTAQHLGWIMMLLATHPEVTEKLLEELKEHGLYGQNAKDVAFDDLADLSYLTAIIKEGMRIAYSLSVITIRIVPRDMDILGYRIPKGTFMLLPGTRAVNTIEEWGDPDVFRPERWLTGDDMSNKYNLAFSTGPRDCVGQKLAMLEMRLSIIKLITRYELKVDGDWVEILNSAQDGAIMEAVDGVWFHVTPRATAST